MDIRQSIADLLSLHDCVIIPGFGGFIGNYLPARIDPENHTFHPPAKTVLFNINLKHNDGLLANAVARTFNTSYSDACSMIDEFAVECRASLKNGKNILLPQVGNLYPGIEGTIHFEQDQTANLLPEAFGLSAFISPPVFRNLQPQAPELQNIHRRIESRDKKTVLPGIIRWAAVIALPLGIAALIGYTQYGKFSNDLANNAGILAFTKFTTASPAAKKAVEPVVSKALIIPKIETPSPESAPKPGPTVAGEANFAVIVGAFRIRENADKLVTELQQKGFPASIFDQSKTGLFRVAIGTSAERAQAIQLLATAKSTDFSGAWLLVK
jgi:nucleoid DNA-binding protein